MANTVQHNVLESYRKEIVQYLKDGKEHNDFFKTKDRLENIVPVAGDTVFVNCSTNPNKGGWVVLKDGDLQ